MKKWEDLPASMRNSSVEAYYAALKRRSISLFVKRVFDIAGSIAGLAVLSPVFLILAVAIKADSRGPVFFRQERITRYGRPFRIFKFRTMVQDAEKRGVLLTAQNDDRITRVGRVIRKYRLDEIPQLINILTGDMSFVGTRPEVRKYVDRYTDEMQATLLMRAGVTSMASILFKDEDEIISRYRDEFDSVDDIYIEKVLPMKMTENLKYIKEFNVLTDIRISIQTVLAVLKK